MIVSLYRGSLGNAGTAMFCFEEKSVISLEHKEGETISLDEGMEHAIEVGAEDVRESQDEDGNTILQVGIQNYSC